MSSTFNKVTEWYRRCASTTFICRDEAFPLRCDLLKTYSRTVLTNDARIFNLRLSHARRVVLNPFGILANHWRLYHRHINLTPSNPITVIKATLVLHNILTLPNVNIWNEVVEDHVQVFDNSSNDLAKQGNRPATTVAQVCTYFTEYFSVFVEQLIGKMKLHISFKIDT